MPKMRTLHEKRERLEADGATHRRDCECARCEAGFTPTEHDRTVAALRAAAEQGRRAAVRADQRKKEKARLRQLDLEAYFRQGNHAADAEVQRLRELGRRALVDRRMDELLRLRRDGFSLDSALTEVDRRFPPDGFASADNDNAWGDSQSSDRRSGSLFRSN